MAIYYKFKSAKDYDTMAIDGAFISLGILKDKIFETKRLGSGKDLDIVVSNAQTNEEYLDEAMLLQKNTSVLVRRVPRCPRIRVFTTQEEEPRMVNRVVTVPVVVPSTSNYLEEDEFDDFGDDVYSIPQAHNTQLNIPRPHLTPVDEESKIQALCETPALDWQRQQGPDSFAPGSGYNRGMNPRGFANGMERKTPPPPGYICHRCNVPGHFIQHCPTNGDPTYDVKRVKPPTGIPKSMLVPNSDGSYSLSNGVVAVLKPNEDAFDKEMERLPSTSRSLGELPPELKCPLCKQVMKYAALASKCCFRSFCDECIRDYIIAKSKCVCGVTGVLADDLLPNKTLRNTINRILEDGNDSSENTGSVGNIPVLESALCSPPKALSPTTSVASKPAQSSNNDASTLKPPMETTEITSAPRASEEVKADKPVDVCESTQGSVTLKEPTTSKLNMQPRKEEVQQQVGPDYMMQMGPGRQYFNGMQPGFNCMQPGFNGFHPGFNGFGPIPGAMPPFMNYRMDPKDLAFNGMNMMHPNPFVAFPNIPPAIMSRDEVEARKAEMLRKRENELRSEGGKMVKDGESNSRMMMNNGASASASSINPNKSRQASRHQKLDQRERDHRSRECRDVDRSRDNHHHRDWERNQLHSRKRSEPPSSDEVDRHFKRKSSRYEQSPLVMANEIEIR